MVSRLLFFVPYFFWGRWLRVKVFDDQPPTGAREPAGAATT
jgi:hypothetical protein